jgi:hypothetical protein
MTGIDVRINNQGLGGLLASPPRITDQLNAVCRTLELTIQQADGVENYLGQPVELFYGGSRWFIGFLARRSFTSTGAISYVAYDPLYYLKRNTDDWYFRNMTGTQIFKDLAAKSGIRVSALANTGAVFPYLYYQGAAADKIAVDILARTAKANGKKFWYRYQPDEGKEGMILYERTIPAKLWAFQVGVNLVSASYEDSIEEAVTVVKLVNRETGKKVTRVNADNLKSWGHMVEFQEVDKDEAKTMEKKAQDLLTKLSKVKTTMTAEGVNPDQIIPQLYSGDIIYVEEKYTQVIGAYYIENVTQTFENDNLVRLGFDIKQALDVPEIQYQDATKKPQQDTKAGTGVQQNYSKENQAVMEKYGIK